MSAITKINTEQLKITGPTFLKSKFAPSHVRIGEKPLNVKLTGSLFMLPRKQVNEQYGTKYSMGVKFNETDMIVFDTLLDKMGQAAGDGFKIKYAHQEGKIFFKLPLNGSGTEFKLKSNIVMKPNDLESLSIETKSDVTVEMDVDGWYLKEGKVKSFGLNLELTKVHFGKECKPRSKKRKTSEDEVSSPDSN